MADLSNNTPKKSESMVGPIIGSIIAIVILILAGLYFWGQKLNSDARVRKANEALQASTTAKTDIESIKMELNDTSVKAIEAKINIINK